jgi:hypothetical protein
MAVYRLAIQGNDKQDRENALYKLKTLNALRIATMTVTTNEADVGSWQIELLDDYIQVRDDYRAARAGELQLANLRYDANGGILHIFGHAINIRGLLRKQLCEVVLEDVESMTSTWGHEEIVVEWQTRGGDYSSEYRQDLRKPYDAARSINKLVHLQTNGEVPDLFISKEGTIRVNPKYLK